MRVSSTSFVFVGRDDQVVLAERDAGLARLAEAELHHAVGEDHRLLLAAVAVDDVDDVADLLLRQQLVDQAERHVRMTRQDLATASCGRGWFPPAP